MPQTVRTQAEGGVDAELFFRFTATLRATHERLCAARVSAERRSRWQRRLLRITEAATRDLARAEEQLRRFCAELDRELGVPAGSLAATGPGERARN